MNEAVLAPVRVPAGRQGGPRTNCAAGWSHEAAYRTTNTTTSQGPAERAGPSRVARFRDPVRDGRVHAMVGHARDAPPDVPPLGRPVPACLHAAARLRAALPGTHAGLPGGRPPLRHRPDRAGLRGRWWRRALRARHPGRDHEGDRAARRALGARGARGGADRGRGVAARRPLPGGAGRSSRCPCPASRTPGPVLGPGRSSACAGPAPCWRSTVARRRCRPTLALDGGRGRRGGLVAALRGGTGQRLRRAAPAGGRRRGGAAAPPGRS